MSNLIKKSQINTVEQSQVEGLTTALNLKEDKANKGLANGYASLDGAGLVPSSQLPSFVDDVLEFANLASFPATGQTGKIYVALDTNKTYRWGGSSYIELNSNANTEQVRQLWVNQDLGFTDRQIKNTESLHDLYFRTFDFSNSPIIINPKTSIRANLSNNTLYNIGNTYFNSNFSLNGTNNNTLAMVRPSLTKPLFVSFTSTNSQFAQSLNDTFYSQGVVIAVLRTPTPTQQQVVFAKGAGVRSFINVDQRLSLNANSGFIAGTTELQANTKYYIVYAWDANSATTYKTGGATGGSAAIWINGVRDADGDGLTITSNTSFWTISRSSSLFANFDLFHFSILNTTVTDDEVADFHKQITNLI